MNFQDYICANSKNSVINDTVEWFFYKLQKEK